MLQILHNPHCSKSNCALDYLKEHHVTFELRDYQQNPLSVAELKAVCRKLDIAPEALVRKKEPLFREKYSGQSFSDEEWLNILAQNPVLLQRPIVFNKDKGVIARPAEKIEELLF